MAEAIAGALGRSADGGIEDLELQTSGGAFATFGPKPLCFLHFAICTTDVTCLDLVSTGRGKVRIR